MVATLLDATQKLSLVSLPDAQYEDTADPNTVKTNIETQSSPEFTIDILP